MKGLQREQALSFPFSPHLPREQYESPKIGKIYGIRNWRMIICREPASSLMEKWLHDKITAGKRWRSFDLPGKKRAVTLGAQSALSIGTAKGRQRVPRWGWGCPPPLCPWSWVLGAGGGRGAGVLDHLTVPFGPSLCVREHRWEFLGSLLLSSFEEHRWMLSFKSFEKCYVCDVFLTLLRWPQMKILDESRNCHFSPLPTKISSIRAGARAASAPTAKWAQ